MIRILLVLLITAIGVSSASAQGKPQPVPAGTTRVAVVNMGYVFGKYQKALMVKKDLEETIEPFKKKAKDLIEQMNAWQTESKKSEIDAGEKGQLDTKILKSKHQLEELQDQVSKVIKKRQEDNLVTLWKEVQDGVKTYAIQQEIDLIIGFGDPMEKEVLDQFPNVNRKMQAMDGGSALPLFVRPGVDISEAVVELLNRRYRQMSRGD
jgi:Skp family chaperone for outer membrane proteins